MGTRGITKVTYEGAVKVAQYGQWDHYPSGQGVTVLNFLKSADNIAMLKVGLSNVWYPSESELETFSKPYTHGENGMMSMDMGDKFARDFPSLTRNTGAEILSVIAQSDSPVPLYLDSEFEHDDLWCEGVYSINLDDETFTTRWNGAEYTFTFAELADMSAEDYAKRCNDSVVSA